MDDSGTQSTRLPQAEREHKGSIYFYGLKVKMMDCLSIDLGSIPSRSAFAGYYVQWSSGLRHQTHSEASADLKI